MTTHADADRWALFMLRLLFGALFIYHGFLKGVTALHGPGLGAFAQSLQSIGVSPGLFWAWAVSVVEFVGVDHAAGWSQDELEPLAAHPPAEWGVQERARGR